MMSWLGCISGRIQMNSRQIKSSKCLAAKYPAIAAQWHPEKNGGLSPCSIGSGSDANVWWICSKGHIWQTQVHHRTKGNTGCPYCSGRLPIKGENDFKTLYPELADEWCYEKNAGLNPEDILPYSNRKIWWKCKKGHDWQATPCHRVKNHSGCPYCSGRYPIKGENDLETLYPDLAKEWNHEKNGDLKPSDCKPGSNKKVWWICSDGHEWQTKVYHRTSRGTGCPYCAGNFVLPGENDLLTLFPEIAAEFDVSKNGELAPSELCGKSGKKVWWICEKGHSWQASVISRTNLNADCPFCAGQLPVSGENDLGTLRPNLAAEWHPDKNKSFKPSDCTISSGKKVWWRCKKGHEWQSVVSARTGKDYCGCPYCYGRYPIPGVNDLATINPSLAAEWHFEKNKNLKPSQVMPYSNRRVWWICGKNHEWKASVADRTISKGCPFCSGRRPIVGETDLATLMPEIASEWDYEKNNKKTPQMYTRASNFKVWWKCKRGHTWRAQIATRTRNGSGCPECAKDKVAFWEGC